MSPTECEQERLWDVWEDLGGLPLSEHLHQKSDTVPGLDYHVSITLVGIWWIYVHMWMYDNGTFRMEMLVA